MTETPVLGSIVDRFSNMGLKGKLPSDVANQGKKVSWANGVIARCRLLLLTTPVDDDVVGVGIAVGAPPEASVGGGAVVAVAEEPQATMNTRSIEISTAGFLRMESFMTDPPRVGTPNKF
jgi:hypothetical protein